MPATAYGVRRERRPRVISASACTGAAQRRTDARIDGPRRRLVPALFVCAGRDGHVASGAVRAQGRAAVTWCTSAPRHLVRAVRVRVWARGWLSYTPRRRTWTRRRPAFVRVSSVPLVHGASRVRTRRLRVSAQRTTPCSCAGGVVSRYPAIDHDSAPSRAAPFLLGLVGAARVWRLVVDGGVAPVALAGPRR